MLNPRGSVLLQEGVNLISAWNKCKHSDAGIVMTSNAVGTKQVTRGERLPLPCSGSDSAMTNLQSGSFLCPEGRVMPTSLHFQYSMAVRRSPIPSWFMTKPSSTSSSLPEEQMLNFNTETRLSKIRMYMCADMTILYPYPSMKNLWKPKRSSYHLMTWWVVFLGQAYVMWSKCVIGQDASSSSRLQSLLIALNPGKKLPLYFVLSISVWHTFPTMDLTTEKVTWPLSSWTVVGGTRKLQPKLRRTLNDLSTSSTSKHTLLTVSTEWERLASYRHFVQWSWSFFPTLTRHGSDVFLSVMPRSSSSRHTLLFGLSFTTKTAAPFLRANCLDLLVSLVANKLNLNLETRSFAIFSALETWSEMWCNRLK